MRALILLFIFFCSVIKSQESTPSSIFSLKPSLGVNGCQVHGDSYDGYRKIGFFGGLAVNAFINKKISLELGFYFSQKGSKHAPTKDDPSYYRLNLNYIDLPLLFRYHLNTRYFFTIGPSLAYLISYNENNNYTNVTGNYIYNKFEVGINTGLGRKINDKFQVEVRFSNSIMPIRDFYANVYYPNPIARLFTKGYYNNIVTLMLTYKIDLRKTRASQ
jgi:hypothetical protein